GGVTATIRIRLHHLQGLQRSFYDYSQARSPQS
ncbi:sensor histidine kinase, partial [Vibrio cholerae]|nr:sensor histidine kinase [Vibrio cholerae]